MGWILRSIGLLVCVGVWWWVSSKIGTSSGEDTPETFRAVLPLLASFGMLIVAGIIFAKPLVGWIGDLSANLFMPSAKHDKPQPMYSIPEGRMAVEDYEGALEAYTEMAAEHPTEIVPHLRMMEIWLRVYQDLEAAQTIRDNALQTISGEENKKQFEAAAKVILYEAGVD